MQAIPKMRTIKELVKLLKEEDPQTAMTERAIRYLADTGAIPAVKVGTKYLISVEAFSRSLNGEPPDPKDPTTPAENITPILPEWWKQGTARNT